MDSKAQHLLINAVELSFAAAASAPDAKIAFCEQFTKEVDKIHKLGLISDDEHLQIINSREQVFLAAVKQMNDPAPHSLSKGMKTTLEMFGPQFIIEPDLRNQLIMQLGHAPVWAVVSTFGTDTMYAGMTFPEAYHRAQIEALECGREASVVLRIERFTGPPFFEDQP